MPRRKPTEKQTKAKTARRPVAGTKVPSQGAAKQLKRPSKRSTHAVLLDENAPKGLAAGDPRKTQQHARHVLESKVLLDKGKHQKKTQIVPNTPAESTPPGRAASANVKNDKTPNALSTSQDKGIG